MILAVLLGLARADEPPADARAQQASDLLASGQPAQAILIYQQIVDNDPRRIDAWEGLTRARLAAGDTEGAARAADRRLELRADDKWRRWRLFLLGLAPTRRDEAILGYQAIVAADPKDADAARNLALFLSWSPGRVDEAVAAWRRAVEVAPQERSGRLGLARTLAWSGANAESAALFDALIEEDPKDFEALLGRSQLARWTGDQHTARVMLERAEAVAPNEPRIRAERSRLELDSGRVGVAKGAALAAVEVQPNLYEGHEALDALDVATSPRSTVRFSYSQESTSFHRLGVAVPVDVHVLPDTQVRFQAGYSRLGDDTEELNRLSLGAEVRQGGLPQGLYARGAYAYNAWLGSGGNHAIDLEVGTARPLDLPLFLRVGARQRALVDNPLRETGLSPLDTSGSGGATLAGVDLSVREAYVGLDLAPVRGMYVYGEGAYGQVEDNGRRTVSAGLGEDVLRLAGARTAHSVTVRYDLYWLSLQSEDLRYFSPDSFLTHTPGLEWRWSPGRVTVGLEGGAPIRAGAPVGWLAGGYAGVRIGEHLELAARGRVTDDTAWRASGVSGTVTGRW